MAPMQIRVEQMALEPSGVGGALAGPKSRGGWQALKRVAKRGWKRGLGASKIDMRQGIAGARRHVAPARLLC